MFPAYSFAEELAGWNIEEGGDGFAIENCVDCPGSEPLDPAVSGNVGRTHPLLETILRHYGFN